MKDIKTRTRVKNIKKLDRFSNLMEKAKPVDVRSKHKSSNRHESESTGSSVVHAQNQSVRAAKTTLRNGMRISSGVSKGAIRLLRKKTGALDRDGEGESNHASAIGGNVKRSAFR